MCARDASAFKIDFPTRGGVVAEAHIELTDPLCVLHARVRRAVRLIHGGSENVGDCPTCHGNRRKCGKRAAFDQDRQAEECVGRAGDECMHAATFGAECRISRKRDKKGGGDCAAECSAGIPRDRRRDGKARRGGDI